MDFSKEKPIKLTNHLEDNISSMYSCFDRGHDYYHFREVTDVMIGLYKNKLIDDDQFIMLYSAAAYHDTGRIIDNYEHEKHSAVIFNRDKFIQMQLGMFTDKEMEVITNIILHHRGKYKAENELEKIMKDADHISARNLKKALLRILYYQIDNYDEIYKEDPAFLDGIPYKEQLLKMVKKQIDRKPIHFVPQSEIVAKLYPEVSYNPTDNDIMDLINKYAL